MSHWFSGSYLRQITSRKLVGAQIQNCPNRNKKFSKSLNNWHRLNMFKATEVEGKIREINLLIDMQINFSLCRFSDHCFSLLQAHSSHKKMGKNDCCCVSPFNNDKCYPDKIKKRSHVMAMKRHRFPKNNKRRQELIAMISKGRENFHPGKWTYVCSNHFRDGEPTTR